MKRPLLVVGVSFAIATWAAFFLGGALILSAVSATAGAVMHFAHGRAARVVVAVLLAGAAGFAAFEMHQARAVAPLRDAVGREVAVQGVVTAVDARRLPIYSLTARVSFPGYNLPDTVLRMRGWGELIFEPGDGIQARVLLEDLLGSQIFHNSRGVFLSARLIEYDGFLALSPLQRAESFFLQRRAAAVENLRHNASPINANMLTGMALGYLGDLEIIDPELGNALRRAGVLHLVVVSGFHLSLLVGLLNELLRRLGAGRHLTALAAMAGAAGFALLVGLSPSILRALIMMLVYLGAGMLSRRSDSLNSLGFSLLVICLAAPHWMLDRGLWLSFCATAGIVVWSGALTRRIKARYEGEALPVRFAANTFLGAGAVTLSAFVFTLPVAVATIGWISLVSPFVNMLVAPLAVPALVFGLLGAATTAAWVLPFVTIADISAGLIADISRAASALPFAVLHLGEFYRLLWLVFVCAAAAYLVRGRAGKQLWKYAAALAVIVLAAGNVTFTLASRGTVEVAAIEGISPIVLTREGSAVVVGTPELFEWGRLTRYLAYRGITRLDAVIAYDASPQITSALMRLVGDFDAGLIIGPDDAHILGQMARAMPGVTVLSGGYAAVNVLGGANIRPCPGEREVEIRVGGASIVKSGEEYAIIETLQPRQVRIWQEGVLAWPDCTPPVFEPLGAVLFGERRIVLSV